MDRDIAGHGFEREWIERELAYGAAECINATVGNYTKAYETWRRNRNIIRSFEAVLAERGSRLSILDAGCGKGYHLFALHHRFGLGACRLIGIDTDALDLAWAERLARHLRLPHVEFRCEDVMSTTLPDASFDVVLCSEVVEHIPDPGQCIARVARLLKPGATAILTTPNGDSLVARLGRRIRRLTGRPPRREFSTEEGEHVSVLGARAWERLIRQNGLTVRHRMRGSPIWGGERYNRHPILFSLVILADRLLDHLPFTIYISENVAFRAVRDSGERAGL